MKTYDPKKISASFANIPLDRGLADGTFITVTGNADAFTYKVGVDGEVVMSRSHDRTAMVTFTCMQTSEVNARLSALHEDDRDAVNGRGVGVFQLRDLAGETVLRASAGRIMKTPDAEYGAEAGTREWQIFLADYRPEHGGTPDDAPPSA